MIEDKKLDDILRCSQCGSDNSVENTFCTECGSRLNPEEELESDDSGIDSRLLKIRLEKMKKPIKRAKAILTLITVLYFGIALFFLYFVVVKLSEKWDGNFPDSRYHELSMKSITLIIFFSICGGIFLSFRIWANSNPFMASLVATILIATFTLIRILLDPASIISITAIINIAIIIVLARAIKPGLSYNRLKQEMIS